jgi:hypothetical protein
MCSAICPLQALVESFETSLLHVCAVQVEELRDYLRQLGLSDEGGRYVLRDRLMTMLVVRRAATAGDMDYLLRQLSQVGRHRGNGLEEDVVGPAGGVTAVK